MTRAHAILTASGSSRWLHCTPSARLEERLRDRLDEDAGGSVYAKEGTKAHTVCELKLRKETGEINDYNFSERLKELGEVSREMDDATDVYVAVVLEKFFEAKRTCPDAKLMLETRVDLSRWVPHSFGTSDAIIISDAMLDVIDYKNGMVPVDAVDNPQLRLYGLGALALLGDLYDFPVVRTTICQPHRDSITTETLTREELLDWAEAEVRDRAQMAWEGQGEFCPGDHCRFCLAKAICPARAAEALKIFGAKLQDPALLSDEEVAQKLTYIAIAKSWIADLENYALSQALRGQRFRGFKLVHGRSNRSWKNPEEVTDNLLRAGYKREDLIKTELRGVAEVEKLLGKKAFRTFAEPYVFKPEGKLTLAQDSDRRPEVSSADADFSDMVGINTN